MDKGGDLMKYWEFLDNVVDMLEQGEWSEENSCGDHYCGWCGAKPWSRDPKYAEHNEHCDWLLTIAEARLLQGNQCSTCDQPFINDNCGCKDD